MALTELHFGLNLEVKLLKMQFRQKHWKHYILLIYKLQSFTRISSSEKNL